MWREGGGYQSLTAPALSLISCSQGPNCRHFPSEVSGHFQKQFQENIQLLLAILLSFPRAGGTGSFLDWGGGGGLESLSPSCPPPAVTWTDASPRQGEGPSAFLSVPPSRVSCLCLPSLLGPRRGCFFPPSL